MLTPLGKKIVIRAIENTHGNIIVSGSKPTQFKIIRIGDEVSKVKAGDIVYLDKYAGCEIEHEKEKFMVIEESQILAKVD